MNVPDQVDTLVTVKWLNEIVGDEDKATHVNVSSFVGSTGYIADLFVIKTVHESGEEKSRILKLVYTDEQRQKQLQYGLSRESLFYQRFAKRIASTIPRIYYSSGNMLTGDKCILMEALSGVETGKFFGKESFHNRNRSLDGLPPGVSWQKVAALTFSKLAHLHSTFYNDSSLCELPWLRGSSFESHDWITLQNAAKESWTKGRERADLEYIWKSTHLVACVEASIAKVSFDQARSRSVLVGTTLVQGDCHPGNALYFEHDVKLVDWEMCSLGSGPQELGQYLVSHANPQERKESERSLVESYHEELNVPLSFELCWDEYKQGGAGRWIWLLCVMLPWMPKDALEFFHDQLDAFLHDHFPDVQLIPQPRV